MRVLCYCVGVNDPTLPSGDRIAHLLLALRADEEGFATVANLAFSGARWRVRRRLAPADAPRAGGRPRPPRGAWTPGPCREQPFRPAGGGRIGRRRATMHDMSAPSAVSAARVLLVERRDTVAQRDPNAPKVRRYRLARLQLNGRATGRNRFEHLRRTYD